MAAESSKIESESDQHLTYLSKIPEKPPNFRISYDHPIALLSEENVGVTEPIYECEDGKKVSVKIFKGREQKLESFRRECEMLKSLDSHCVVRFEGAYQDPDNDELLLVMEPIRCTLYQYLQNQNAMDTAKVIEICSAVCDALSYLHHLSPLIVHGSVSMWNIMLTTDEKVKLANFCRAEHKLENFCIVSDNHPTFPQVPELRVHGGPYDEKVDIFALGIVMNEVASRKEVIHFTSALPKVPATQEELFRDACRFIKDDHPLKEIMLKCMQFDPKERFDSAASVAHLLKGLRDWRPSRRNTVSYYFAQSAPYETLYERAVCDHQKMVEALHSASLLEPKEISLPIWKEKFDLPSLRIPCAHHQIPINKYTSVFDVSFVAAIEDVFGHMDKSNDLLLNCQQNKDKLKDLTINNCGVLDPVEESPPSDFILVEMSLFNEPCTISVAQFLNLKNIICNELDVHPHTIILRGYSRGSTKVHLFAHKVLKQMLLSHTKDIARRCFVELKTMDTAVIVNGITIDKYRMNISDVEEVVMCKLDEVHSSSSIRKVLDKVYTNALEPHEVTLKDHCWLPFGIQTLIVGKEGGSFSLEPEIVVEKKHISYTKIVVPADALDDKKGSTAVIRYAILGMGPFQLPVRRYRDHYVLGSMVVYVHYDHDHITKPIDLYLPTWYGGCASLDDKVHPDGLRFAVASHQLNVNGKYTFELLQEATFNSNTGIGVLKISEHNSLYTIVYNAGAAQNSLHYAVPMERKDVSNSEISLKVFITPGCATWITILRNHWSRKSYSDKSTHDVFQFKKHGALSSSIENGGGVQYDWTASAIGTGKVSKRQVSYKESGITSPQLLEEAIKSETYPPKFQFQISNSSQLWQSKSTAQVQFFITGAEEGPLKFVCTIFRKEDEFDMSRRGSISLSPFKNDLSPFRERSKPNIITEILHEVEDQFLESVSAKDVADDLWHQRIIPESLKTKIHEAPDSKGACRLLYHHLLNQATLHTLLSTCEVFLAAEGYARMNELAQRIMGLLQSRNVTGSTLKVASATSISSPV